MQSGPLIRFGALPGVSGNRDKGNRGTNAKLENKEGHPLQKMQSM